ncbi:MAG: hypothetical protein Fur002_16250 [Anaerolineales bacterium]
MKKIFLLLPVLLSACISIAVDAPPPPTQANFITATLPPTLPAYIAPTLTPAPLETLTPTPVVTMPAHCVNSAVLLRDVTIPDGTRMAAGETFIKTWAFQNNGTCPWLNYALKFAAGDPMSAPLSQPIPLALPGETVEISVELTAPNASGSYAGYFTLNTPEGKDVSIGTEKTFWVKIVVP